MVSTAEDEETWIRAWMPMVEAEEPPHFGVRSAADAEAETREEAEVLEDLHEPLPWAARMRRLLAIGRLCMHGWLRYASLERCPASIEMDNACRAMEEDWRTMDYPRRYKSIHMCGQFEHDSQHHVVHASKDGFGEAVVCAPLLGKASARIDNITTAPAKEDKEACPLEATKCPAVCAVRSGGALGIMLTRPAPLRCLFSRWHRLLSIFSCPGPVSIPIGESLGIHQLQELEEQRRRDMDPGYFNKLTIDARLVMDCLWHYNSMRLGDEYEPAPGKVTRHCHMDNGICWTHGNFVAHRKRSGVFSFLPVQRTLFFFELAFKDGFDKVVTCTPLLDEPVTEPYSVLGFPLWWSTRRSGRLDCICKTCNRRLDILHPDLKRTFACGHKEVERVCRMCYQRSNVLHPSPGEFVFGHNSF